MKYLSLLLFIVHAVTGCSKNNRMPRPKIG